MKNRILTLFTIAAAVAASPMATAQDAAKGPKKLTFAQADADSSGGLTVFEFAKTQGDGTPLVEIRRRFLPIDVSGAFVVVVDPVTGETSQGAAIPDGVVSLEEWQAYRALDEKVKSDLSRFALADFDGDGLLSPVEFRYLVSPKSKASNMLKKFNKLDLSDDGFLSKSEFKKETFDEI